MFNRKPSISKALVKADQTHEWSVYCSFQSNRQYSSILESFSRCACGAMRIQTGSHIETDKLGSVQCKFYRPTKWLKTRKSSHVQLISAVRI